MDPGMSSSWPRAAPTLSGPGKAFSVNYGASQQPRLVLAPRGVLPPSEFEAASLRINPPRVVFDNSRNPQFTLLQVDSANRYGCLLEVVQLLTDLGLIIVKAFISSDGGWFVDEFQVTDAQGNKLQDEGLMNYIREALGAGALSPSIPSLPYPPVAGGWGPKPPQAGQPPGRPGHPGGVSLPGGGGGAGPGPVPAQSVRIEMTGRDRPGLLRDVSALLAEQQCNVVDAQVWTHRSHVACVVHVTDTAPGDDGTPAGSLGSAGVRDHVAELTTKLREIMQGEELDSIQEADEGSVRVSRPQQEAGSTGEAERPGPRGSVELERGHEASVQNGRISTDSEAGTSAPGAVATPAGKRSNAKGSLGSASGGKLTASSSGKSASQYIVSGKLPAGGAFSTVAASPTDGLTAAVWALEEKEPPAMSVGSYVPYMGGDLHPAASGVAVSATQGSIGGPAGQGGGAGPGGPQAWGITPCSTKLERRLHQLLAASEGLQDDRQSRGGGRPERRAQQGVLAVEGGPSRLCPRCSRCAGGCRGAEWGA